VSLHLSRASKKAAKPAQNGEFFARESTESRIDFQSSHADGASAGKVALCPAARRRKSDFFTASQPYRTAGAVGAGGRDEKSALKHMAWRLAASRNV